MAESIRILIADDHPVVQRGLRALIETQLDMEVVGVASDGEEAVELARSLRPNVILMDIVMPKKTGLEAIADIKSSDTDASILVITSFAEDDNILPAIKSGALGYLLKDSSPEELLKAIRDVYAGESSLHPAIARKLIQEINRPSNLPDTEEPLTERELEVIRHVARGVSNQDIAASLGIAEGTVGKHVSSILDKLHLANRTQAALYALREGLADLETS